jgi:hypothetical protein
LGGRKVDRTLYVLCFDDVSISGFLKIEYLGEVERSEEYSSLLSAYAGEKDGFHTNRINTPVSLIAIPNLDTIQTLKSKALDSSFDLKRSRPLQISEHDAIWPETAALALCVSSSDIYLDAIRFIGKIIVEYKIDSIIGHRIIPCSSETLLKQQNQCLHYPSWMIPWNKSLVAGFVEPALSAWKVIHKTEAAPND